MSQNQYRLKITTFSGIANVLIIIFVHFTTIHKYVFSPFHEIFSRQNIVRILLYTKLDQFPISHFRDKGLIWEVIFASSCNILTGSGIYWVSPAPELSFFLSPFGRAKRETLFSPAQSSATGLILSIRWTELFCFILANLSCLWWKGAANRFSDRWVPHIIILAAAFF